MNLLIAPSIRLTNLLSASLFCEVHLLLANLFLVKIKQLTKASRVKHFVKNRQRLKNDPMILDIVRGYEIFYFVAKAIKATKSVSFNQRSVRPSGSRGPGHVEEGCYSIFGSQGGPISKLFVSFEKERWGESPSSQPKEPEQKYSVSALQGGRVVPIKRNVVTRGPNVQDRPQECILRNPRKILEVRQIPVERPIRVLLPLLRAFSSSSRFYKAIKSPYLSLLRKLSIRTIIYLDDILLMASLLEDLLMARDTLIFILQHLGFLINTKKSYIEPTSTLEFLGVIPDSGEMTLNLPKEKRLKVQNHCQES